MPSGVIQVLDSGIRGSIQVELRDTAQKTVSLAPIIPDLLIKEDGLKGRATKTVYDCLLLMRRCLIPCATEIAYTDKQTERERNQKRCAFGLGWNE